MDLQNFYRETDDVTTTPEGGKQTSIKELPTELPFHALLAIAQVMGKGAGKYGSKNWHGISVNSEIDHSLRHLFRYMAFQDYEPDRNVQFEELAHYATRALMALDQFIRNATFNIMEESYESATPLLPSPSV
ncbi:MAG: DUF5664 domain-containing protein [Planctomycetaceae bacterium]|nr:DUF5664 domain-containing protein [Planctomycetaceae bacterium]